MSVRHRTHPPPPPRRSSQSAAATSPPPPLSSNPRPPPVPPLPRTAPGPLGPGRARGAHPAAAATHGRCPRARLPATLRRTPPPSPSPTLPPERRSFNPAVVRRLRGARHRLRARLTPRPASPETTPVAAAEPLRPASSLRRLSTSGRHPAARRRTSLAGGRSLVGSGEGA
nr:proline-rich receptor-like protein kinase PERK2 [Aegilops tauschii subsp. strangulata]